MDALEFNIDACAYPVTLEQEELSIVGKLWNRASALIKPKSHRKPNWPAVDKSKPPQNDPGDLMVLAILRDYLQTASTIAPYDASTSVIDVFCAGKYHLSSVPSVCLEVSEQIPYHHSAHLKLAQLLWLIGQRRQYVLDTMTNV